MICKNCGANNPADVVTCPYCGTVDDQALMEAKKIEQQEKLQAHLTANSDEMITKKTSKVFGRLTIAICAVLSVIMIVFGIVTYSCEHQEEWYRKSQVSGANYKANLERISNYLDNKQYGRALALVYATSPDYSSLDYYPDFYKELFMIDSYAYFIYDIQNYITYDESLSSIELSTFKLEYAKDVYDTTPTNERCAAIKEELSESLDLYLRYYYRLTAEELEELKEIPNIEQFQIEGTTHFENIIQERMAEYEKNN